VSRVAVVFTGGTISMVADPTAGGVVPALDGAAILARTPGLDEIAEVVPIDLGRTPASHFSLSRLLEIGGDIRRAQANAGIDGVVVVQGTDTIEETAFLWDLVLDRPEPVVVTGAMRAASDPDYEGPANIRDAVRCAAAPVLRGAGVVVVLGGSIEAADAVTKTHASAFDTFHSLDTGPLGGVVDAAVTIARPRGPRRQVVTDRAAEDVVLVTATVGVVAALADAITALQPAGLVVEATGAGNTSPILLDAAIRAMAGGTVVVLASRCPAGAASAAYAFPGGGGTWVRAGALLAGHLSGPKARVALALGLGAGLDRRELADLLADPLGWGPVLEGAPRPAVPAG
jgi:L-asparaginase